MAGMVIFWLVLAMAIVALAVVVRAYPLMIASVGMALAAGMASSDVGLVFQIAVAGVLLAVGIYAWMRQIKVPPAHGQEHPSARMSGMGGLTHFSAFSDESDQIHVAQWNPRGTADVMFRGREWKARLGRGARPRVGLYRVREVRDGQLVLDEVVD